MQRSQIAAKTHVRDLQRASAQVMQRAGLLQPLHQLPDHLADRLDQLDRILAKQALRPNARP